MALDTILSHNSILERAELNWNSKNEKKRISSGRKYNHIFTKLKLPANDWKNNFDQLTNSQRSILIKGELIRTYDSLPNREKTTLKKEFGLSHFSSKWFKLSPEDKKILLKTVLK